MNEVNWISEFLPAIEKLKYLDEGRYYEYDFSQTLKVSPEVIFEYPEVFQPRPEGLNELHAKEIEAALSRGDAMRVEPILVFPYERPEVGCRFIVVDGHHRLHALRKLREPLVPVTVFMGSASEAQLVSIRENSKHTKSLTLSERTEAAWRLCQLRTDEGEWLHSKTDIIIAATVGETTVAKMRKVIKKQEEEGELFECLTWREVRAKAHHHSEPLSEDELGELARALARRIPEHVVRSFQKNPDRAARALAILMGRRTGDLIVHLIRHGDLTEEERDECRAQIEGCHDEEDPNEWDY